MKKWSIKGSGKVMAIMNKRTMADDTHFFQYRSVTSLKSLRFIFVEQSLHSSFRTNCTHKIVARDRKNGKRNVNLVR